MKIGICSATTAFLLACASLPSISSAIQPMVPKVVYKHLPPDKVISAYRDAYARAGMTRISRHIERTQTFADKSQEFREEIRFSKPPNGGHEEYASFYLQAYTRNGVCLDCAVTRDAYSFGSYADDWRATRKIRQVLGQSLPPVCDTACPASVEDWINGKSDKIPIPDAYPRSPGR